MEAKVDKKSDENPPKKCQKNAIFHPLARIAVIEKMKKSSEYTSADLEGDHKKVVLDMISRSFAEKGDLTTLAAVSYEVLQDQLEILWPALLEAKLSIVVKDKSG